jgi:hypothetical protein
MRRLFDFRCDAQHTIEHFVDESITTRLCDVCDDTATRVISPVRSRLDHTFPGEAIKWARKREAGAKIDTSHDPVREV